MFVTARQLELMLKAHGQIVLPYRARLTPAARDWVRLKKLSVGYSDIGATDTKKAAGVSTGASAPASNNPGRFLWWADAQSGTAKAAIAMVAREANLQPMSATHPTIPVLGAIRELSNQMKSGAVGGIFVVSNSAKALVLANRSPALRAVVASTLPNLEQAIVDVAANLLIVEADKLPLMQMKSLIARFVKAQRTLSTELSAAISEATTCV